MFVTTAVSLFFALNASPAYFSVKNYCETTQIKVFIEEEPIRTGHLYRTQPLYKSEVTITVRFESLEWSGEKTYIIPLRGGYEYSIEIKDGDLKPSLETIA